jgi:hypothetical protein
LENQGGDAFQAIKTFALKGASVATPQISQAQWKALPAQRKTRDAKGVRFLKVKEGDGEKLVEVRVFANPEHIKEPVPADWLQ